MADKLIASYPHRRKKDGSYDSICLTCFVTVAFGKSEAELTEFDKKHICKFTTFATLIRPRSRLETNQCALIENFSRQGKSRSLIIR
jgi:hypothetical protein